jgi:hypothetical protein
LVTGFRELYTSFFKSETNGTEEILNFSSLNSSINQLLIQCTPQLHLPLRQVYALEKEKEREAAERATGRSSSPVFGDKRARPATAGDRPSNVRPRSPAQQQGDVSLVLVHADDPAFQRPQSGIAAQDQVGMRTSNGNFSKLLPKITSPSKQRPSAIIPGPERQDVNNNNNGDHSNDGNLELSNNIEEDFNFQTDNNGNIRNVIRNHTTHNNQTDEVVVYRELEDNPLIPQDKNAKYFKGLEQRFSGNGGGQVRRSFNASEETQRIRPITAPLRPLLSRSQQGM